MNYERISVTIDNTTLLRVPQYKYLGVLFASDMHWKEQINNVCSKLAYGCHVLLKARDCFDLPILRVLYFAFVHSQLSYCLEAWGGTYKTYLDPVSRLQKRAIRMITYSNNTHPSRPLFQQLRILPLSMAYKLKIAEIVNNVIKSNNPLPLSLFRLPMKQTRAATNNLFNLPPCYNMYGRRLLEYSGAHVWNEIPNEVKEKNNFSASLKHYLISMEM